MNVATAVSFYVDKIVADPKISGLRRFSVHDEGLVAREQFKTPFTAFGELSFVFRPLSCFAGMKVLLLDAVTTQVVAMVYSQSQILEREVYLVERLDADHEPMQHLKAVYFIRPTKENIQTLCTEISRPRFAEYHVFFCSICPNELLQQLAAADEHEGGRTSRGA